MHNAKKMDSSNEESFDYNSAESLQKENQSIQLLSRNSILYQHAVALSNFLQKNQITNETLLNSENRKNINQLISNIANDLSLIDSFSQMELSPESTISEVYQLLSYALYITAQNNNNLNRLLADENQSLKKELSILQSNYNQLTQNKSGFQDISKSSNDSPNLRIKQTGIFNNEVEKYKDMEKEVSNLIIYLRNHFNLSESTNLYNIIDAINIKCTCEISEKDRIEQLMMQNQDLEDRLMNLQNEKYEIEKKLFDQKTNNQSEINSQIFLLENEINALKSQLKNIAQKCESRKLKSQSLIKTINEQNDQIKQLTRDLETSKINYDKLLIDFEDKKKNANEDNQIISNNELQIKDDEIRNLHSALNELSAQLEKMNEDLMSETTMKNHLFNALQFQNEIMNNIEKKLKDEEQKRNEQRHSKILLKSSILSNLNDEIEEEEEENEYNNQNLINDLIQYVSKSGIEKVEIEKIENILQNEDLTFSMKIKCTLNSLLTTVNLKTKENEEKSATVTEIEIKNCDDDETMKSQNYRLKKYLANLLYFIEKVSSSGEIQNFFIESDINYDFRGKLVAQCTRIETFLKENGIDIDEENFILENSDFSDILFDISNFSNDVEQQVYNPDAQELLLLLRQFAFVNDAIRRFADEMKTQAEKFLSEIKQLRYQISENQEQHTEELNKTTEALQNEIKKERTLTSIISQIQTILLEIKISEENVKPKKDIEKVESSKSKRAINRSEEVVFEEEEEEAESEVQFVSSSENNNFLNTVNDQDLKGNNELYILKCLQLIQSGIQLNDFSNEVIENNQNSYVKKIETKLNNEIEKRKKIESKAREEILKLQNKIKRLKKQSSSDKQKFLEEIDFAKKQIDDLSASFIESHDSSNKSKSEIEEKNTLINSLNEKVRQQNEEIEKLKGLFDLEKEKIIEEYQSQSERIFKEKDDRINTLLLSLENSQSNSQEKVREMKQDLKLTIKKLQSDLNLETERANHIRDHYEKLLNDLKEKLNQARASEKVATEKVFNFDNELKSAKSTISKLRIDLKMLSLKVVAADDKLIRERSLFDSQLKMKILGLQTEHHDEINELKEKYENDIHKLFMKICEIFKDFIDFNMTFSEDSVLNILQQVSIALNQSNQKLLKKKSISSLLYEIKSLLNVNHDKDIISTLTNIINEANEYKDKKILLENNQKKTNILLRKVKAINNNDSSSREWEVWAKRLYSLITESFSTPKSAKQLQYAIEEALLSAIGQRQLWKKLEILRKEKSILTSGLILVYPKRQKRNLSSNDNMSTDSFQSLISLIAAYISIYRMQKLAGHLKFNIDFSSKKDNC